MKSKKSRKRTPSPDFFGPRSKKRRTSQEDDNGFDQELTEEALREMMYEEAH